MDYGALRAALCKQFDEDTVQQVLLELLEEQARGVLVENPLHWCRMCARRRQISRGRREQIEREGKQTLSALGIPYDTRSITEQAKERKRRERKRRVA